MKLGPKCYFCLLCGFVAMAMLAMPIQAQLIPELSTEFEGDAGAWEPGDALAAFDFTSRPGWVRTTDPVATNFGSLLPAGGVPQGTYPPPWHAEVRFERPLDVNTAIGWLIQTEGQQTLFQSLQDPGGAGPGGATYFGASARWTGWSSPDFLPGGVATETEMSGAVLELYFGVIDDTHVRYGVRPAGTSTWIFAPDNSGPSLGDVEVFKIMVENRQGWFDQWSPTLTPVVDTVVDFDYIRVFSSLDSEGAFAKTEGSTTVAEDGPAFDTYQIEFMGEPNDITVTMNFDSAQVSVTPPSLNITAANWADDHIITVTAVDDPDNEGPHQTTITHSITGPAGGNFGVGDVVVDIIDNDLPGVTITESGGSTDLSEAPVDPNTDTYDVVLLSTPTADVIISIATDGQTTVALPVSGQLTFDSGNWNIPQTVTVAVVDDNLSEGPHTGTISHSAASADANYQDFVINAVAANITDNEPFCGTSPGGTPSTNPADISGPQGVPDCLVDLYDFTTLSANWFDNSHPCFPATCDLP
jgi:hypothetical protein